ncbi:hypothetical protein D9M68_414930 [compost metagenome]
MIEAVDEVLKHWGERQRAAGPAGGLGSPMGAIVAGCVPRGGMPGSRLLVAGAGGDYLVGEVDAALAAVERGEGGVLLVRLARMRYGCLPELALEDQVYDLDLGRGEAGERAYFRALDRLHVLVQRELQARNERLVAQRVMARRDGDRMRRTSKRLLDKAHADRVGELHKANG